MIYVFKIAFRYFFSKNEQTVINRINLLSLILVIISSASLFIVLSAFDGLKTFGLSFSNKFDADFILVILDWSNNLTKDQYEIFLRENEIL